MTYEIGEVALEGTFESLDAKGNSGTIKLRLGIPFMISESSTSLKWCCPYQIIGIGSEKVRAGRGMDAIDVMLISLRIAEIYLNSYSDTYGIKITWLGEDWLGFPFSSPGEIPDQDKNLFETEDDPFEKIFDEFFLNFKKNSNDKP